MLETAVEYSKSHNILLYCIATGQKLDPSPNYKIILDDNPLDFLYLLYNSELNFLGSFHGICLSLILNKKFVAKFTSSGLENRINTVFTELLLPNCKNFESIDDFPIGNWIKVKDAIDNYANKSKQWIESVISKNPNE